MRDFGQRAAGREFPVRAAHHLAGALDRAQQAAQCGAVRRSEAEGAGDLAGGQGLRIGAQKLDEVAVGRQPGAGTEDRGSYGEAYALAPERCLIQLLAGG